MKKLISLVLIALICVGLLVACGPSEQERLENVKTYLDAQMKNKAEATPDDYVVYDVISMNEDGTNVQYSVTWSVTKRDGTAISADDVKVDVNAETGETKIIVNKEAEADIPYTLTATIKNANGVSITTSYNRKVPKFTELTWAEFVATANDEPVVVKGIINGIVNTSKYEVYMQDNDGGYYVYGLTADQVADLQVGQEIRVRGIKALYNSVVHEVKDATIEVLNATPVAVEAKDITDAISNISDLTSTDATKYQSMYVKIDGAFILGQISGNDTYYDVLVNGKDGALLQTYLRISGSANILNDADTTAFKNAFLDNEHKDATISGIVSIYNNQIYLIPCTADAAKDFTTVERNDAGKLAIEKTIMDKVYDITEAGKVTLQATGKTYTDVTFTWSLTANDYVTLIGGNVLNTPVLPDNETTITLAVTIQSGEATEVKPYTLKVSAAPTVVADTAITVVPETAYVFFVNQKNIPQKLYWNGQMDGKYLATTTNPEKAAIIKAKLVADTTDKYILYRDVNGAAQYINIVDNAEGTSPTLVLDRFEANVKNYFSYNAELGIFTVDATVKTSKDSTETTVKTYYLGCYSSYDTMSLSEIKYITGSNAANLDVTQHPARFATLVDITTKTDAEMVAREKADLDIKVDFATAGTINLPANGGLFGKVVITWSAETNNGAVVIENGVLTATPQDAEETVVVTATLTLGDATDTKTFNVVVAKIPTIVPVKVDTPALNTPYKFALNQQTIGKFLYFNGTTTGFLGTTEDYTDAVDVYIKEASTGAYTISFMDGTTEKFVEIYKTTDEKVRIQIVDASTMTYSYDSTLGVYVAAIDGKGNYYIGTYDTFNTFSASGTNYITNAGNFTAGFYTMIDSSAISDADKVATEKADLDITESIMVAGTTTLPVAGTYDDVTISYDFVGTVDSGLATLVDGVLTVVALPVSDTTVQIKATISCGDASDEATFDVVIKAAAPTPISEILSTGAGTYKAAGTVVAVNNKSFLIKDDSGIIMVYLNATPSVAIGDTVTVLGTVSAYNSTLQFSQDNLDITTTASGTYTQPTATEKDGAAVDAYAAPIAPEYIKVSGILTKSGSYYNLIVPGASAKQGSLTYLMGDLATTANSLADKLVTVTGYTTGISSGKYLNLMVTEVVEIAEPSDALIVAYEQYKLSIQTSFDTDGSITLPTTGTTYTDVLITWTKDDVAYTESTLSITQTSEAQTIVLVATLAKGDVTVSKTFTVTVAAKAAAGTKTETLSIAGSNGTLSGDTITWSTDSINFTAEKGSSNSSIRTSDSDHFRIYVGFNFTIAGQNSQNISKIVFTATSATYANNLAEDINYNTSTNGCTATVNGSTVTIVASSGSITSLTFTPTVQTRVNSIEVSFTEAA